MTNPGRTKRLASGSTLAFVLTLSAALASTGCLTTAANPQPAASPTIAFKVFDYTNRVLTDITGTERTPSSGNPYQYGGLLNLTAETSGFDSNIGIHAHDPGGVQQLTVSYDFYTCAEVGNPVLLGITSLNNGGTKGQSSFTLTSLPSAQNGGKVTEDLSIPMTITSADLTSLACPNGKNSSENGTIEVSVTAQNFSTSPATQTTLGLWDIRVGNPSPVPQPPGS